MNVELIAATPEPERAICLAARNDYYDGYIADESFDAVMDSIDGDNLEEKQETLIGHLLSHGHFGPFEHPQATFAVEGISRSCMAQLTRHRHASFDVQSMRYVAFDDAVDDPEAAAAAPPELSDPGLCGRNASFADAWETLPDEQLLDYRQRYYWEAIEQSFEAYNRLLDLGFAPENARFVLPIGTEVNLVFSTNIRMLMHVADMRAAADSQWEIRELTEAVLELAAEWAPITFDYYETHMKGRKNRLAP